MQIVRPILFKRWLVLLGLLALNLLPVVYAELDSSAYQSNSVLQTPEERLRIQQEIAAERAVAVQQALEREQALAAERAKQTALQDSLPYPKRLYQMRCGTCHATDSLSQIQHTQLGWSLTISRMRWLNGATTISTADKRVLSTYLAETQGKQGYAALLEHTLIVLVLALLLVTLGVSTWGLRRFFYSRKR